MEALAAMWGRSFCWPGSCCILAFPFTCTTALSKNDWRSPLCGFFFGVFQPITALIAYYLIRFIREELRRSPGENR